MNNLTGPTTTAIRKKVSEIVSFLNTYVPNGTIDVNGVADAIILDADGDTTISAPTDDQIDIEVNGADDFRITANKLEALSGSVITLAGGSVSAPALNFSGATTMGLYMSSAAELGFAVGGEFVARMSLLKGLDLNQVSTGLLVRTQAAPVNSNTDPADKAVMAASFITGLLTATPGAGINYTLPTGTQMDTACAGHVSANEAFEFSIINIGAGGIITFVAASGFTIVGTATVATNTSARFMVRKTAANTFVLYRLN